MWTHDDNAVGSLGILERLDQGPFFRDGLVFLGREGPDKLEQRGQELLILP
jgi:hypothetical protein